MAETANKLNDEQKEVLTQWLAAEYSTGLILDWFEERQWPEITKQDVSYYRKKLKPQIETARKKRHESALNRGLSQREERIARLSAHADALESIKWEPDDKGRLHNEKAWRETLGEIAAEMGHRKQSVEVTGKDGGPIKIREVIVNLAVPVVAAVAAVGKDEKPVDEPVGG